MIEIKEVHISQEKMDITDFILHLLPNWFGIEGSIQEYINISKDKPFWAVFDGDKAVGFLCAKEHTDYHAEICVMGVLEEYHRMSIGRGLFNIFQNYYLNKDFSFISVKTLDESRDDEFYAKTRQFYLAMGFKAFEILPTLWGEENPCLMMIKDLRDWESSYKCKRG